MKKLFFGIIVFCMLFAGCAGSSRMTSSSGDMTLDEAIAQAAASIDERLAAGAKIAPLNFNSPSERFSLYVLDELTANLVDSRKLIVVDRSEIDLIRGEFAFQYSGEVGDDSMQSLGRMLGAQSIISGSLTDMGGFYRIVIRVLNVQNASVEVQYRANIINDSIVASLLAGSRTVSAPAATSGETGGNTAALATGASRQTTQQSQSAAPARPTVIAVEGATLAEKLEWLAANVRRNSSYYIEVTANETIAPQTLSYSGRDNVSIAIAGAQGRTPVLTLSGSGTHFTIGSGVTLGLGNITLQGRERNSGPLVSIQSGGTFILSSGAKIIGNSTNTNNPAGVSVGENARFLMRGGEISGNTGYGVYTNRGASFVMENGEIFGNRGFQGGGVQVGGGNFIMRGGEIYGNTSERNGGGGGVFINRGTFTMHGGEISGNTASNEGGGVYIAYGGTFTMEGGEISGNRSPRAAGVFYAGTSGTPNAIFTKTGGTIYGFNEGDRRSNIATGGNGHAVGGGGRIRNSTAGPRVRLDGRTAGGAGGWEN